MADGTVGLAVDGVGKKIDTTEVIVGANTVERQRIQIAGSGPTDLALVTATGDLMVAIRGTVPMASVPALNNWGQALSAVAGSTVTINSVTAIAGYRIKGMVCHGTGDGYFTIQVASVTVLSGRIRVAAPVLVLTLPNGIVVSAGAVVRLLVTNESGATADYEATLLGE